MGAAFESQTTDETDYGRSDAVVVQLTNARTKAREERIKANRAAACGVCESDTRSTALQLQSPRSGMS